MAKITPSNRKKNERETIVMRTQPKGPDNSKVYKWWKARSKADLCEQVLSTVTVLKEQQQYRYKQVGIFARLYGNMPLFNYIGSGLNKMRQQALPLDRPTMNVVQSCVDTLTSRITQSRPRPVFLTDNGDYKERNLAKQLNGFIQGELFQTNAYRLSELVLRDAEVLGTGCVKIYETPDKRVGLERVLLVDLLVDPNDALLGNPRQLFQLKLVDRDVLQEIFPKYRSEIAKAQQAYPDTAGDSSKTISDQVMVAEAWHLPSGDESGDGRHVIVCSEGVIFDSDSEEQKFIKQEFPFIFLHYSNNLVGFWGQGLAEQLMGTQVEINKLLMTISKAINLVGVPRVFVEDGSKVMSTAFNNEIGSIIKYSGVKPTYEVAPCVPVEMYEQLQRLVGYAYQQSGISSLASMGEKPKGLDSGEAIRSFDEVQSDRFAALNRRYDNMFIDLAYQIIDKARDIAEREGKYQTVYPNKNGTKQIDLPKMDLLDDPFIIQCYDASALPKDPAGRLEKVVEMMQAGIISMSEGRRLLDYPDIEQVDKLANASEERILQILDEIVDKGKYTPPDPFMNLELANQLVTQYYNLYAQANLEEDKAQMLRDFFTQVQTIKEEAMAGAMAQAGGMSPQLGGQPQALPEPLPTNPMIPNATPNVA